MSLLLTCFCSGHGWPNKVELLAVDEFGNCSNLDTNIYLEIRAEQRTEGEDAENIQLPEVEHNCKVLKMNRGKLLVPRISLREKIGNYMVLF